MTTCAILIDLRDLVRYCSSNGYTTDNLEALITKYIGDRYAMPIYIPGSIENLPLPYNSPPMDVIGRYIDGAVDELLTHPDQDSVVNVTMLGTSLLVTR